MNLSLNERPLNGCLFESTPVAAAEFAAAAGVDFPALVDLRAHCSPVEDQRLTNSCTANAIVGALEYHQIRAGHGMTDLSRMFVYYNARQLAGAEDKDVGSFIHHVMAAVLAHGACEERLWPFQEAMCMARPTDAAYKNALKFQAVQYARTPLGAAAMAALASGLPVVFGTYLPQSFFTVGASTGTMPGPAETVPKPGGGHAMLLVGYDLQDQTWLVRNSWGTGWADGGYVRIPFATLKAYSDPTHFWTIGAIENAPKLMRADPTARANATALPGSSLDRGRIRANAAALSEGLTRSMESKKQSLRDRLRGPG